MLEINSKSTIILTILDIAVVLIVGILGIVATFKTTNSTEKGLTARKIYENIYFPIFKLIEPDLYRTITHEKAIFYGSRILSIISENPQYLYPSLRIYAERLLASKETNYQSNFKTLCWSVDKDLDKYSRIIGSPVRSSTYRLNEHQYDSKIKLFYLILLNVTPQIAILFAVAYLLRLFNLL